jgi:integration host factor subunit beta
LSTVTKKTLIDKISQDTAHPQIIVKKVVQVFLDEIVEELVKGNRVEFRGFGVFEVKQRASRTGRNPRTGQKVHVPKRKIVNFRVGRSMKDQVQNKKS